MDQLKEGHQGPIVVMICREWDLHNINGKYLSTNFVVSDEKENVMHSTMKSNVSHCFIDKIKEGNVVSMRSFTVQKNNEYRILKDNAYLIELNGSTSVRKATTNVGCFVRHPFQLMEFEAIQPTEKKYMIDVTGYITNVGKYVHVTPRQWQKLENAT
ncbi:replication protein A 70 kDa DNA-binding subunit C-like protein [Tanacetum coccineum]